MSFSLFQFLFSEKIWEFGLFNNNGLTGVDFALVTLACVACVAAVAYMLGSVNTAIILTRLIYRENIREKGSGNPGMTNVMRNYGLLPAAMTLIGDMLKCMLAMMLGTLFYGIMGAYVAGFACIIGHVFPVFYKFKGGKGVSATFMFIFYVDIFAFVIMGLIFIALVFVTKYLSLGSIMTGVIFPFMLAKNDINFFRLTISILIGALIVYRHWANIGRIMDKTESRFSFKKTVKKSDIEAKNEVEDKYEDNSEELTEEELAAEKARKEMNRKKSKKKKK